MTRFILGVLFSLLAWTLGPRVLGQGDGVGKVECSELVMRGSNGVVLATLRPSKAAEGEGVELLINSASGERRVRLVTYESGASLDFHASGGREDEFLVRVTASHLEGVSGPSLSLGLPGKNCMEMLIVSDGRGLVIANDYSAGAGTPPLRKTFP